MQATINDFQFLAVEPSQKTYLIAYHYVDQPAPIKRVILVKAYGEESVTFNCISFEKREIESRHCEPFEIALVKDQISRLDGAKIQKIQKSYEVLPTVYGHFFTNFSGVMWCVHNYERKGESFFSLCDHADGKERRKGDLSPFLEYLLRLMIDIYHLSM